MTRRRLLVSALAAATWVVACEPTEEIVFRGSEIAAGGFEGGATGGTGGGTGGAFAAGGSGGTAESGGAPQSGGAPESGGASQSGGAPATGGASQSGGAPATGGAPTIVCTGSQRCQDPSLVCNKSNCLATFGECVPLPDKCGTEFAPVCGCDGVTYWNDCLRLLHRVIASTPGDCGSQGVPCSPPAPCGMRDARCVTVVNTADFCPRTLPQGTCWVPPPLCGPSGDPTRWLRCSAPNTSPNPQCVDFCNAVVAFPGVIMQAPPGHPCGF